MRRHAWNALAVTAVLLLGACGPAAPMAIYELGEPTTMLIGERSRDGLPVVVMARVIVPDYLDSTDILRRTGPNAITASPHARWGERLSLGLTDALAADLSARLPGMAIVTVPESVATYRIGVTVTRFDILSDGRCVIEANWRIVAGNAAKDADALPVSAEATRVATAESTGDAAVVATLSAVIGQLADLIAQPLDRQK